MTHRRRTATRGRWPAASAWLGLCVFCLAAWLATWSDVSPWAEGAPSPPAGQAAPTQSPSPSSAPALPARSVVATSPPVGLDIPAIDLATTLIRLGLEEDRTVEVPTDPDRAGWFELGTPPGAVGSSVILGHVDSVTGPAVFARLEELERGDVVRVRRSDGSVLGFEVLSTALYDNADFPAQRVYAAAGSRRLNLVTCGGEYDADRGGYQSNLVVYTRLVDGSAARP